MKWYKSINFWIGVVLMISMAAMFDDKIFSLFWWKDLAFGIFGIALMVYYFMIERFKK